LRDRAEREEWEVQWEREENKKWRRRGRTPFMPLSKPETEDAAIDKVPNELVKGK
jgi:hypothetical protein